VNVIIEALKNHSDEMRENNPNLQAEEAEHDNWSLESIQGNGYLPPRKPFINDQIYKLGAALAAILALAALLSNNIFFH